MQQPPNTEQQPLSLLHTNGVWWRGECQDFRVWMDTPTFLQYAFAYLLTKKWKHPTDPYPSREEVIEALNHCQETEYWRGNWKYGDPNVHIERRHQEGES